MGTLRMHWGSPSLVRNNKQKEALKAATKYKISLII